MALFSEVIHVRKIAACKTCETYSYLLPCNLNEKVEKYLAPFGKLAYPLSHVKIIKIENEFVLLTQARVGANKLKIKFKKNGADLKPLFDVQIAAFVEEEHGISIQMDNDEED